MRVSKIHRALKFNQEAWMTPYINMNTQLCAKATSNFEKDYFKLAKMLFSVKPWITLGNELRSTWLAPRRKTNCARWLPILHRYRIKYSAETL